MAQSTAYPRGATSSIRRLTRPQPRSLLSMARVNSARSRARRSSCSRVLLARRLAAFDLNRNRATTEHQHREVWCSEALSTSVMRVMPDLGGSPGRKSTFNLVTRGAASHFSSMLKDPNRSAPKALLALKSPERNRTAVLGRVAELRRLRDQDASQAMKEHQANRLEVLAKTARLRADRMARVSDATATSKRRKKT
jgi:hypothetical protein